jgi:dTDP-4-dehydrorhamnose reductase
MKILVTGSGGRLGAALCREYSQRHDVVGFNRAQLDLASPESIRDALAGADFDALINCAAATNVDWCETHEAGAMRVNAGAVGEMAALCAEKRARFVHIGTDYVFDGEKAEPYGEDDPAQPLGIYGKTKRRGEIEALTASDSNLVVRVAWVFGPDRPSFIDMLARRALENDAAAAIADKWSSPSYTLDIARHLEPFLGDLRGVGGILHVCNPGGATWQEYGQFALDCLLENGVPLKARTVAPLAMADMKNFVARRPVHSVLSTEKLERLTGSAPRPWRDAVAEYVREHLAPALLAGA